MIAIPDHDAAPAARAGDPDRVEIRTVGIDVGSATFHLAFSRVRLERRARELSTRFDVVARETLWSSPIRLTPYRDGGDTIDVAAVHEAVDRSYEDAGIDHDDIDSGAVLLTGTALARHNARDLADRLAGDSGKFVCAAAGHHLESVLAAHGSGAVERSIAGGVAVVNIDMGGGTTKLALAVDGDVRATTALAVGARLLAWDSDHTLTRVEEAVRALGLTLEPGDPLPEPAVRRISDELAAVVVGQLGGQRSGGVGADLLLTRPFPVLDEPYVVVLSGGVAEYLADCSRAYGDLGADLARAIMEQLTAHGHAGRLRPASQRIRATVIGAAQFSTQVSGSTVCIGDPSVLPVHNVPVVRPRPGPIDAGAVRQAIAERAEDLRDHRAVAVAIAWDGLPEYRRLRAVADGIHSAVWGMLHPPDLVVITVDRDLAASLGRILIEEIGADASSLICIDNIDAGALDYLDLGRPAPPANVIPVVIKSLLFDASDRRRSANTTALELDA